MNLLGEELGSTLVTFTYYVENEHSSNVKVC